MNVTGIEQVGDDYLESKVLQEDSDTHLVYVTSADDPAVFVGENLRDMAAGNDRVKLVMVDAYAVEFAETYQVLSIPTIFLFKKGKPINTIGGFVPAEMIAEVVREATTIRSVDALLEEIGKRKAAEE